MINPKALRETLVPQISYTVDLDHSRINGPPSQHRPAFAKDRCKDILATQVGVVLVPTTLVAGPFPSKLVPIYQVG